MPRCRCSRNGTTTRSPTTGGRVRPAPTIRDANASLLAARGRRAFCEYMPMRQTQADTGRIYRKISYGPLLDIFLLDMRSYRGPNDHGKDAALNPACQILGPTQIAMAQARARGIECDLEGDRRRSADLDRQLGRRGAGRRPAARPRVRDRRPARPSSSMPACATRCGSPPTCITRRRITTIPNRAVFQDFEPFWEFVSGPMHAGTWGAGRSSTTRSGRR